MAKTGWKRSLGTSKREQGIVTFKAPQNREKHKQPERTLKDIYKEIFGE